MKPRIYSAMLIIAVCSLFYSVPQYGSAGSELLTTGTITVCYNLEDCAPPSGSSTKVVLIDAANGGRIDSCVIPAGRTCCSMTGDYATSTYHFEYSQPGSSSPCSTGNFQYNNGDSPTLNVICTCP